MSLDGFVLTGPVIVEAENENSSTHMCEDEIMSQVIVC